MHQFQKRAMSCFKGTPSASPDVPSLSFLKLRGVALWAARQHAPGKWCAVEAR